MSDVLMLTLPPLGAACLAAVACALPGNFLILRRQAMLGDAMAHVVLPGIVVAFLLTGTVAPAAMIAGAMAAALLSAGAIDLIRRATGTDPGAAMGIAFTAMFALGVALLEWSGAAAVHLDVEHALYGNLESLIWLDGTGWDALTDPSALASLPVELAMLAAVAAAVTLTTLGLWRLLVVTTFDEEVAAAMGLPVRRVSALLVGMVALAAVAAFAAVGSILTIALLILPPATARLWTDDLRRQVILSAVLGLGAAAAGWIGADALPRALGLPGAVSASGMIAVVAGLALALSALIAPRRAPVQGR